MLASGLITLREGLEAALLPILVDHVWDLNPILSEEGTVGAFLKALFGYNGDPSLLEVLSYVGYYIAIYAGTQSIRRHP